MARKVVRKGVLWVMIAVFPIVVRFFQGLPQGATSANALPPKSVIIKNIVVIIQA